MSPTATPIAPQVSSSHRVPRRPGCLIRGSMKIIRHTLVACLAATTALHASTPAATTPPPASQALVVAPAEEMGLQLDAVRKEQTLKPGEESCVFTFAVKNISKADLVINQVRTSCGCTIAQLPSQPWKLAPGASGNITLTVDVRGKSGTLIKTATIDLPTTYKHFSFIVHIPASTNPQTAMTDRERNMQLAAKNRQAVFHGDCARCHLEPTKGRQGVGLYVTACSICHDAEHRASMVPDLHAIKRPDDREYWRTLISQGKPGSLMPAFAQEHGGPLSKDQIDSLVDYLVSEFAGKQAPAPKVSQ